jgi:hypothetical protein
LGEAEYSLRRSAVARDFFSGLASSGHTRALDSKTSIFGVRVFTLTLGPMSLHRFGVAHQASFRSLLTMMTYANSLPAKGGGYPNQPHGDCSPTPFPASPHRRHRFASAHGLRTRFNVNHESKKRLPRLSSLSSPETIRHSTKGLRERQQLLFVFALTRWKVVMVQGSGTTWLVVLRVGETNEATGSHWENHGKQG